MRRSWTLVVGSSGIYLRDSQLERPALEQARLSKHGRNDPARTRRPPRPRDPGQGQAPWTGAGRKDPRCCSFSPACARVSFEVGMQQLGGHCINLSADDLYELEPGGQAIMDGRAEEHVKDAHAVALRRRPGIAAARTGTWEHDRQELLLQACPTQRRPGHQPGDGVRAPAGSRRCARRARELVTMQTRKLTLLWCDNPEPKPLGPPIDPAARVALGMDVTSRIRWASRSTKRS